MRASRRGRFGSWILVLTSVLPGAARAQVTTLLENDQVRVYEATFKLGFKTPQHTHPGNEVTYVLSGGRLKVTLPDGTTRVADLTTGQVGWRATPETHIAENVGDTEVNLLTVQLKQPAGKKAAQPSALRTPPNPAAAAGGRSTGACP